MSAPATVPVALFLADAGIVQTMAAAMVGRFLVLPASPLPETPFLAVIEAATDRAILDALAACESCRAVVSFGAPPALPESRVTRRAMERPAALSALLSFCEKTWASLHQPPRALAPGLLLDSRARTLEMNGRRVELTSREAELLDAVLEAGEAGIERERLLQEIWRYAPDMETHTLETHVYRLRQKLEKLQAPLTLRAEQGRYRLTA